MSETTETTVVHVNDPGGFNVYIGRAVPRAKDPRCHKRSVWANPYSVHQYGLIGSLQKYESMCRLQLTGIRGNYWRGKLEKLRGQRIACWCKKKGDEPCHGDVLVKLLGELADGAFDKGGPRQ